MTRIYLDHAATTPPLPEVCDTMVLYMNREWGNPSSLYDFSDEPRRAVADARAHTAALIHADPKRIFFTSGGSESDSWALIGCARLLQRYGNHIIVSAIEHHAILHAAAFLESKGFAVTYLSPDPAGFIHPERLRQAMRPDTILVSVMMANNEIGTIQPIADLSYITHTHGCEGCLFHTDAVQAYGQIPIDVQRQGIDLLSASAHKIYGPKGIGLLYIRDGIFLSPLIFGGGQEGGIRGGTENVPAIAGFGTAAAIANAQMRAAMRHESVLRDYLIRRVLNEIPFCRLNGSSRNRLPGNANFSFEYVEGSSLLMMLDAQGICVSSGSACSSASSAPSHVLSAIGLSDDLARASLRLTLGRATTKNELDTTVSILKETIAQLRSISDSYQERTSR